MTASTAPQAASSRRPSRSRRADGAPRPPPGARSIERGRRDPQPRHAEHVDAGEQQHGERGAEVVEDRADDELGVRRDGSVGRPRRGRSGVRDTVEGSAAWATPCRNAGIVRRMPSNRRQTARPPKTVARRHEPSAAARAPGRRPPHLAELGRRVGLSSPAVAERLAAARARRRDPRLPRRHRPARARLHAQRDHPHPAGAAPARRSRRPRAATRPRSSSATASPATTAS